MKKRFALYATVLALCCAVAALAAISRDFSQGQTTGSSVMTHTFTNAAPANSNRILLAVFSTNGDLSMSGTDVTAFDFHTSEALTANSTAKAFPSTSVSMELWYLTSPTATTDNVVATTSNNLYSSMHVVALSGIDTVSPFRDADAHVDSSAAATSSDSLTLTTQSGDFVLDCIAVRDEGGDPGALVPASGTEFDELLFNTFNDRSSCVYLTASGTSTSAGAWSWTNGSSYGHIAVAISPQAVAGGPPVGSLNLLGVGK